MTAHTTVRVDPHVHTEASFDSDAPLEAVLESAADSLLDGVVVTDHDRLTNSLAAVDRAPAYGLVALPGVEVSTADGHLLAVGVESRPPRGLPLDRTVARVREAGGVAVVPHPFQRTRHGAPADAIVDCDGVEVFNAQALTGMRNRQARRFADREGYPGFAGSDAHRASEVGRAHTVVSVDDGSPTAESVLAAMRAGRTRPVGEPTPPRRYVRKLAGSAKRNSARFLRFG